jgi:acetylornithine deacetylase/succinyl-diaminopimelate desuccinylase-like protein
MEENLTRYLESVRPEFESVLGEWVAIPTVSASPDHHADIRRGADVASRYLQGLGAAVEVVETPGNPVVFARFETGPERPTVTVYNHLDVQPAQEPEWRQDPFTMEMRDGVYYGRGTTDDKGPALSAAMGVRFALEAGVPINVHLIWELEEEIGSPNFERFLLNRLPDLGTDSIVVSDTVWISRDRPAIPVGLRGLLTVRLELETGTRDVHSGVTGGGARNPLTELCGVIGACSDPATGKIRIPGFYDDVRAVDEADMEGFLQSGFSADEFRRAHELKSLRSTDGLELMRRLWAEPTFEVHGLVGGYQGPGVKTAIPPRAEAKISMRLVPDQSPERQFEQLRDFIHRLNPDIRVELEGAMTPFLGPRTGPYVEAARLAIESVFGRPPALVREGGSIGSVVPMSRHLQAPVLFLGLSLPEHGYHAPNENFDWGQASGGIRLFARYLENLSRLPRHRHTLKTQ